MNEAFTGIKNIKLTGHEDTYANFYRAPSEEFSRTTAISGIASEVPRYAMEVIAFGGILFIVLYILLQKQGLNEALPLITLYAFAGYRLMPSFQIIFRNYSKMRFHSIILDDILNDFEETSTYLNMKPSNAVKALPFKKQITFEDVSYKYETGDSTTLKKINFTFKKGESISITGKTGAGKTTLIDLLLGLLSPTSGKIFIDDVELDEKTRCAWQKNCSYVTQHINLIDDTVAANIAFGVPSQDIDMKKVKKAAKMAALSDFVEQKLEYNYNTYVGENGVRLSGGQRQRIGLARALYLDRSVIVLDEATSALDISTEADVMKAIYNLSHSKTIIIISHRPETLKRTKKKLNLEAGKITFE